MFRFVRALLISLAFGALSPDILRAGPNYDGYMGFTPWPFYMTIEAVTRTNAFISKNGNIVAQQFDNGAP